ncbi:MAG: response regulator [Campylobacterales bacterium]|nr:response regulator [Campylobacterales bacterium]
MNKERFEIEALKENAKRLKVLCVENHAGTRLKLARFLREYFEVVFVTTYADNAIKMFENGHFDLIIASAALPDMRTMQLCKKIKNIAPKKPIIIVSKNKNANEIIELVNIGISGFITTPLDERKIIPVLSRVALEINDLQMIYNFQDTIEQELAGEYGLHMPLDEPTSDKEIDFDETNFLNEDNINLLLTHYERVSAKEFVENYPAELTSTAAILISICEDIDMYINKFVHNPTQKNAQAVANEFKRFSTVLDEIVELSNIAFSIKKLSMIFETLDYTKNYKVYYEIILALSDELMSWCNNIFINHTATDIHYSDKSLLADALMLESLFRRDAKINYGKVEFF